MACVPEPVLGLGYTYGVCVCPCLYFIDGKMAAAN